MLLPACILSRMRHTKTTATLSRLLYYQRRRYFSLLSPSTFVQSGHACLALTPVNRVIMDITCICVIRCIYDEYFFQFCRRRHRCFCCCCCCCSWCCGGRRHYYCTPAGCSHCLCPLSSVVFTFQFCDLCMHMCRVLVT